MQNPLLIPDVDRGNAATQRGSRDAQQTNLATRLRDVFDVPFAVLSLGTGELNQVTAAWLHVDIDLWMPVIEEAARRGKPAIIEDCAPLIVLAVPLPADENAMCDQVALATFLTGPIPSVSDAAAAAAAVHVDAESINRWSQTQPVWPGRAIEQLSNMIVEHAAAQTQNVKLKKQLTNVSQHLLQTFDELNLLHRINERLSVETDEYQLLDLAVDWLSRVLPAECLLACVAPADSLTGQTDAQREWIYAGECPLPTGELDRFFDRLGPDAHDTIVLIDREVTISPTWYYPSVREVISVPIRSGNVVSGWLVAVNHQPDAGRADDDFGNLETSMLSSVASMLGMHSGNFRLYEDQANFFESVVRAFSSSIDAKDPYTRGHSERVARIAVLIGRQLGCTSEELNSIYLSGLLHDIGKIGIDDNILRKPSALSADEYEHIKLHPELGYQILKGVRQLEHVLPVVLHHHEAWNGNGYPGKLVGTEIPWLARIMAVADAFDAMSSDRPYRNGMPAEKLSAIFREQSGKQWDPQVVEAFFAVRDEINIIIAEDRKQLSLDVGAWNA